MTFLVILYLYHRFIRVIDLELYENEYRSNTSIVIDFTKDWRTGKQNA